MRTGRRKLPPGFVMMYAPRDEKELRVVVEIVRAAVCWVSGRELRWERECVMEDKEMASVGSKDPIA